MGKRREGRGRTSAERLRKVSKADYTELERQIREKANERPPLPHLPFLPEIRDRIYKLLLVSDSRVRTGEKSGSSHMDGGRGEELDLSILLLSKQTYIEAFHIFYRFNQFYFKDTEVLYRFLRNIGYARRQQISTVAFCWRSDRTAREAFRLLKTCTSLKSLSTWISDYEPGGYAALREVRGLEKVSIGKNVTSISPHCDPQKLEQAMLRPRLKAYSADPDEEIDLFKKRQEAPKVCEEKRLAQSNNFHTAYYNQRCLKNGVHKF